MYGVQCNHFIMGQTIIKRNKTFPKKIQLHKANEMLHEFILSMNLSHWFWTTMKIVPCIVNNHNNTFTKTKKLCFQLKNKEKSMGPTFSEEVVNRGRCFSSCHERGTKEKKSESSWGIEPHGDSEFFSLSHARDKTKNIFLYFFTELKTYHLWLIIFTK